MYIDGSDTFTHLDSISYFNRHKISLDENQNSLPIGWQMSYTHMQVLCKFYGTYLETFT
jgi:hypothetical protein